MTAGPEVRGDRPAFLALRGRRVIHLTTTDISLALLLGRQLRAYADAGMQVIGASAPGPWVADLQAWGIHHEPVHHATRSVDPRADVLAVRELVRLFRRLRPDVVHTHNPKPGLYGRLAARLAGVPVIVNTVHGLYATPDDSPARRAAVYGVERLATAWSQAELVLNPEDARVLRRVGVPAHKLVELGGGVDLDRFRPGTPATVAAARRALGVSEDQVVVGTVSRLVWEKGFRELFAAAAALRHRCPSVTFVVVGPMDDAKADALASEDLAVARALGNVHFLGERRDVEALYPGFDLLALPSYREGFPLAPMEAAACGVPAVVTDARGCRQVVDDGVTGFVVPVGDAAALTNAVAALAGDAGRRRAMGRAARRRAERDFDDRRIVDAVLGCYARLLAGSPPGRDPGPSPVRPPATVGRSPAGRSPVDRPPPLGAGDAGRVVGRLPRRGGGLPGA